MFLILGLRSRQSLVYICPHLKRIPSEMYNTIFSVRSCPGDVCGSAEAPYVWEYFDAQGFG